MRFPSPLHSEEYRGHEKIIIATFNDHVALDLVRTKLELHGIECFTNDELSVQMAPYYVHALSGIKLLVEEQDIEQAAGLLQEWGILQPSSLMPHNPYTRLHWVADKIGLPVGMNPAPRVLTALLITGIGFSILLIAFVWVLYILLS